MNTYLITGANRGIGLEYCRQLKERGDNIIAVCRNASDELKDLDVSIETGVDLTSDTDVLRLKSRLEYQTIELLRYKKSAV